MSFTDETRIINLLLLFTVTRFGPYEIECPVMDSALKVSAQTDAGALSFCIRSLTAVWAPFKGWTTEDMRITGRVRFKGVKQTLSSDKRFFIPSHIEKDLLAQSMEQHYAVWFRMLRGINKVGWF
jgi:hypothetical protein